MAVTPAGFGDDFNADEFRENIINTMIMNTPNTVSDRATFCWRIDKAYTTTDTTGRPYELATTPVHVETTPDVQVPVAVEFVNNEGMGGTGANAVGRFDTSKAVLTLLDTYYPQVYDADWVTLGDSIYDIRFWEPPIGLFDVDVYRVHVEARDER